MFIKIIGMAALTRNMKRRHGKLSDFKKLYTQQLAIVDKWIQQNFKTEGKHSGEGWQPLSAKTLLAREKGWGVYKHHASSNPKILQNVGYLKTHWRHSITKRRAVLQSQVDYGKPHHEGTRSLPKRQIIPDHAQIEPQLKKHLQWFIGNAIK